ncbi:MAG TPA: DUF933 domain-containing protein [Candidatus Omnitrophica bacterium]|nr:DUF933 domain-containing protein [Candidatus Omnitrophota bacterium]
MRVFTQIEELLGKKKFLDSCLEKLKERFNPKKVTFYTVDFINEDKEKCDCIVIEKNKVLDLIVEDLEKAESILENLEDKQIIKKVCDILNQGKLIFDELREEELNSLKNYSFLTAKPIVFWQNQDVFSLLKEIFSRTRNIFFFTVNKNEARAHLAKEKTTVLEAASKIHTDLARGFIKAEVYNIKDLDKFKNPQDAQQKGILKIVDRDYLIEDGDVINIRFKV